MRKYRQTAFRDDSFEERVFEEVRDTLQWCTHFASSGYPHAVKGETFHNVYTLSFHGELSTTDTFAGPQSREIDVLLELELPQRVRLLISAKASTRRQSLEHVGDYADLLSALRSNPQGWLYWGLVVARKGFQSGCEATAKRADIALVPPVTGNVDWLNVITEEEVLERLTDAIKVFIVGESWRCDANSYRTGRIYNAVFVATREPSGMPGAARIRQSDGSDVPMRDFIGEALRKPENRFRVPLSRERTYVPFFDPPIVQSMAEDGLITSSPVASTIISRAGGMRFFRVRTETGRELTADGERALYTQPSGRSSRKLVRVDSLKPGIEILCTNEDSSEAQLEVVTLVEEVADPASAT